MVYFKLLIGIALVLGLTWLVAKSRKQAGNSKYLLAPDLIMGIVAGIYLVFTSGHTLIQ